MYYLAHNVLLWYCSMRSYYSIIAIVLNCTRYVCMYGHHISQNSMDQPGKVANPARGQLNSE